MTRPGLRLPSGSLTAPAGTLRLPAAAAIATALSAICLGDTFLEGGWYLPVVFAVLVAGAGNELARRLSATVSYTHLRAHETV